MTNFRLMAMMAALAAGGLGATHADDKKDDAVAPAVVHSIGIQRGEGFTEVFVKHDRALTKDEMAKFAPVASKFGSGSGNERVSKTSQDGRLSIYKFDQSLERMKISYIERKGSTWTVTYADVKQRTDATEALMHLNAFEMKVEQKLLLLDKTENDDGTTAYTIQKPNRLTRLWLQRSEGGIQVVAYHDRTLSKDEMVKFETVARQFGGGTEEKAYKQSQDGRLSTYSYDFRKERFALERVERSEGESWTVWYRGDAKSDLRSALGEVYAFERRTKASEFVVKSAETKFADAMYKVTPAK